MDTNPTHRHPSEIVRLGVPLVDAALPMFEGATYYRSLVVVAGEAKDPVLAAIFRQITEALRLFGAHVVPYVPDAQVEGAVVVAEEISTPRGFEALMRVAQAGNIVLASTILLRNGALPAGTHYPSTILSVRRGKTQHDRVLRCEKHRFGRDNGEIPLLYNSEANTLSVVV